MKKNVLFCMLLAAALIAGGCTRKTTQEQQNSSAGDSASQSESTTQSGETSGTMQNNGTQEQGTENGAGTGDNQQTTMISEEEARNIALNHAGLTADQVTFVKSGIDREDGRESYDVEFYTQDQKEYDYEIDPYTGEVRDYDYDAEYHTQSSGSTDGDRITEETAKQSALGQVPGATDQDIREFGLEYDNDRPRYEGKIYFDQKEYEFEIDAYTGEIVEWDVETIYDQSAR